MPSGARILAAAETLTRAGCDLIAPVPSANMRSDSCTTDARTGASSKRARSMVQQLASALVLSTVSVVMICSRTRARMPGVAETW